ncbi:MAG: TonB family protein [Bacteroidetes bacterium]|nr:TonB family protein [Bacteroidota bacterium]
MSRVGIYILGFLFVLVSNSSFAQLDIDSTKIYSMAEVTDNAEFKELYKFLDSILIYPKSALDSNIQGVVKVKFVVERDGKLKHIKLHRTSGNELLDKEGVRVVKAMPKWQPAKYKGIAVGVDFILPIKFEVEVKDTILNVVYESHKVTKRPNIYDLLVYLMNKFEYNRPDDMKNIGGATTVSFVISNEGKVIQPRVKKSSGYHFFDSVAIYALSKAPICSPGEIDDKQVFVSMTIPIIFQPDQLGKIAIGENFTGFNDKSKPINFDIHNPFNELDTITKVIYTKIAYYDSLNYFLEKNLQYPFKAYEMGITGVVKIGFEVEKDGRLAKFKIVKSSGSSSLDDEALRVVKLMPPWHPAEYNGKKVKTNYVLPIVFSR